MHVPNKEKIMTIILAMILSYVVTSRWRHSRHVPPQTALINTTPR